MNKDLKNKRDNMVNKSLSILEGITEALSIYGYWGRRHRNYFKDYVDFVVMDTIATYIIIIVGFIVYLVTYKSKVIDPIANIKREYIIISSITILMLMIITSLITIFSKNKKSLLKRLLIIFLVSIIFTMIFIGIRINMDNKYSKAKFEQIYDEQNIDDSGEKTRIKISITEIGFISERDYFIEECVKIYKMFQTKTYGIFALYLLLDIILFYQIIKVFKIQEQRDRVAKDDIVLFDEEENIKF